MFGSALWAMFSFRGRMGRRAYVATLAALALGGALLLAALDWQFLHTAARHRDPLIQAALAALSLLLLWAHGATRAKRLHDLDRSGGWALVPDAALIGLFGAWLVAVALAFQRKSVLQGPALNGVGLLALAVFALVAAFTAVLALRPGSPGSNRFGARGGFFRRPSCAGD